MTSGADVADDLPGLFEDRLDAVCETDEARALLRENPLSQQFVFEVTDGEPFALELVPHEPSLAVVDDPETPADELYRTTRIVLSTGQCRALLDGAFLSELYLEDGVEVSGLQPAWLLLGELFGLNHDLRADSRR